MSKSEQSNASEYKERNFKNTRNLKNWTAAWVVSMAISAQVCLGI